MNIPESFLFRDTHEWVSVADNVATIGVSDFAQQQLGDITFVELPEMNQKLSQDDEAAVVESVKAASDVYSPISGVVVEVNESLEKSPELVNSDPYGEGWLFKLEIEDEEELKSLMDSSKYGEMQQSE